VKWLKRAAELGHADAQHVYAGVCAGQVQEDGNADDTETVANEFISWQSKAAGAYTRTRLSST